MKTDMGSEQGNEVSIWNQPIKKPNTLPIWGNEKTMNLNTLVLTNIQSSHYFRESLYKLKTYHEVIDEIYYQVGHLEPWEKGSRKTAGQTGMCGGVRGVGAGGIVSTAFCTLYKLFTLRLTRKQVQGLLNHGDSPYIRGLGFMYIRYTQPPADLWDWFEPYFDDEEEIDARAGGGQPMTVGNMVKMMLTKLDWYSTLFPRIPVPIQKEIDRKLSEREQAQRATHRDSRDEGEKSRGHDERNGRERARRSPSHERDRDRRGHGHGGRDSDRRRDRDGVERRDRDRDRDRHGRRDRSRDRDRHHHSSRGSHRDNFAHELEREKRRVKRDRKRSRSRSRSRERHHKHRNH